MVRVPFSLADMVGPRIMRADPVCVDGRMAGLSGASWRDQERSMPPREAGCSVVQQPRSGAAPLGCVPPLCGCDAAPSPPWLGSAPPDELSGSEGSHTVGWSGSWRRMGRRGEEEERRSAGALGTQADDSAVRFNQRQYGSHYSSPSCQGIFLRWRRVDFIRGFKNK